MNVKPGQNVPQPVPPSTLRFLNVYSINTD